MQVFVKNSPYIQLKKLSFFIKIQVFMAFENISWYNLVCYPVVAFVSYLKNAILKALNVWQILKLVKHT